MARAILPLCRLWILQKYSWALSFLSCGASTVWVRSLWASRSDVSCGKGASNECEAIQSILGARGRNWLGPTGDYWQNCGGMARLLAA